MNAVIKQFHEFKKVSTDKWNISFIGCMSVMLFYLLANGDIKFVCPQRIDKPFMEMSLVLFHTQIS